MHDSFVADILGPPAVQNASEGFSCGTPNEFGEGCECCMHQNGPLTFAIACVSGETHSLALLIDRQSCVCQITRCRWHHSRLSYDRISQVVCASKASLGKRI